MRHEKKIIRGDGSKIRLVAEYFPHHNPTDSSTHFYALVQKQDSDKWELFTPHLSPDKSLGGLSVDEYITRGRRGLLSVVTSGEILKAGKELQEKLQEAS